MGLRGPRALGHVFGKRLAAQGYGYEADRKCQQRHPLIYFSLPKTAITDLATRTAGHDNIACMICTVIIKNYFTIKFKMILN